MREIAQGDLGIHFNPPKASSRQCPLPSGASSIDLEDSQPFVKSDHATSDFGVRRSFVAPWARAELLLVLHPLWRAASSATRNG
jgi:hypothetical protein